MKSFKELKEKYEKDPNATMELIYTHFRMEFIQFARKYSRDHEVIIDAFQEAVIALHQNLMWSRIKEESATVKTYLFTIGKYKLFSALKRDEKVMGIDESHFNWPIKDEGEWEGSAILERAVSKLGDTCQKLLDLFYYRRFSIEAIMYQLGMKNENSVKANKSRCIKQLRDIYENLKRESNES